MIMRLEQAKCAVISFWRSWFVAVELSASLLPVACSRPVPAPFTRAETDRALAPARDLWQRCYAGTRFASAKQLVTVEYRLNVDPSGGVHSVPTFVQPEDPGLVECVRHRLDELRFPARGKDHIDVHFELGPSDPVGVCLERHHEKSPIALERCSLLR